MNHARLKMPLMKWLPFLGLIVFGLSGLAYVALAVRIPVLSQAIGVGALVVAAFVVVVKFNPFTSRARQGDSEGSLRLADVAAFENMAGPFRRIQVVETARRQFAIDAAWALGGSSLEAVLTPRATRMMGREYRVAVDLVANGRVYRAGFLPASIDVELDALLEPFAVKGHYFKVPVRVLGTERPYLVNVELGEIPVDLPNSR
jgi:hypothetical protein